MRYPRFPTVEEFTHSVLSIGGLQIYSEGKLWLLEKFVMEWQHLQAAGILLPDLVELYKWLHTNISHLVTREYASSTSIGHIIKVIERNSNKELGEYLRNLYERVKVNYSCYVELLGGAVGTDLYPVLCHEDMLTIRDDTPLLHLLSGNKFYYSI